MKQLLLIFLAGHIANAYDYRWEIASEFKNIMYLFDVIKLMSVFFFIFSSEKF